MEDEGIKPLRTRVLSNSAAEFVETRAGRAVVAETVGADNSGSTDPEFASALDKFVPPGKVPKYVIELIITPEGADVFQ
jgi:hypothetical protein